MRNPFKELKEKKEAEKKAKEAAEAARKEAEKKAKEVAEAARKEAEAHKRKKWIIAYCALLVSEMDVCAGYDIISFESNQSTGHDRYIEVKAVSKQNSFFWSSNEYEAAKLKGEHYYLYLVDLLQIENANYELLVIKNPAATIMISDEWLVEAETYHICKSWLP